jgi:hypothetical protein
VQDSVVAAPLEQVGAPYVPPFAVHVPATSVHDPVFAIVSETHVDTTGFVAYVIEVTPPATFEYFATIPNIKEYPD